MNNHNFALTLLNAGADRNVTVGGRTILEQAQRLGLASAAWNQVLRVAVPASAWQEPGDPVGLNSIPVAVLQPAESMHVALPVDLGQGEGEAEGEGE